MFRSLPIAKKVVGLVSLLLLAMLVVAAYTFWQSRRLRDEVVDLGDELMPLVAALSKVESSTLEQERLLERSRRKLGAKAPEAELEAELRRYVRLHQEVVFALERAEQRASRGSRRARVIEDAAELARVHAFIQSLRRVYLDRHRLAEEVIADARRAARSGAENEVSQALRAREAQRLDAVEDEWVAMLAQVLQNLQSFTERRARLVREDEEAFFRLSVENLLLALFAFAVGVAVATLITRRIVRPLEELVVAAQEVSAGRLEVNVPVGPQDEVGKLAAAFNAMVGELRARERIKEAFGRYLDPRIVENIIDPVAASSQEGERRVMTVMFSDLVRFSHLAERMTPSGLVRVINRYLTLATEPIAERKGVVDKYIGDAIMAFWGPPFTDAEEHARLACEAALAQLAQLERFRKALPELLGLRQGTIDIDVRIGLCTGDLLVGNIGSERSRSFTVMGDTVNLASRLEGVNKAYDTRILLSEGTYELVHEHFETREIDFIRVVGKEQPVRIYELMAEKGGLDPAMERLREHFALGLGAYRSCAWEQARRQFALCLELHEGDGPSRTFLERLQAFESRPAPASWDGVWTMQQK